MNNVLGAKNLLPNNADSRTYGGITFTVYSDGSVTADGTATELVLHFSVQKFKPNNGNYILSGGIRNGVFVFVNELNGTTFVRNVVSIGNDTQFTLNYSDYDNLDCGVGIESGVTVNNETFYPMLRPASIQDDTYVPYSMTNREMTAKISNVYTKSESDNRYIPKNSGIMIKTMDGVLTYQADTTKTIGQYIDTLRNNILNDIKSLLVGNEFASIKSIFYNYSDYVMENTPVIDRNSTTFDIRMSSLNLSGTSSQFISTIYKFGTDNAQFGETEISMSNSSVRASIKTTVTSPNQSCYVFYSIYKNV
jgi:hypothetical protein